MYIVYIYIYIYIFNCMDAYLRPPVSYRLYTTIIRQKNKDFGEIEKVEKSFINRFC